MVTLGIIGVVAAMTLPVLVANYQKKVWVTQLKKDANFISNSIKRVLADEEIDSICLASIGGCRDTASAPYIYGDKFGNYFGLTPVQEDSLFQEAVDNLPTASGDTTWIKGFYLNDGSCIATATTYSSSSATAALGFFVDVNCDKKPNKWGRDRFFITYDVRGNVPGGSFTYNTQLDVICSDTLEQADFIAGMCFNKIIRDGWEMKY